jgi:phage terminase large subunit
VSKQRVSLSDLCKFHTVPQQLHAYDLTRTKKFILYGGAAGGGKSRWLRWSLVLLLIRFFKAYKAPNVNVALFCEDYPTLRDRQIVKMTSEFPRGLGELKEYRDLGLAFRLREKYGGGAILLRNLDEPSKYDSAEFAAAGIDELTKNTVEVFDEIRKRIRWPDLPPDVNMPFLGATNPGGRGHLWVKQYWITHELPRWLGKYRDQFAFIQAKATDNPHNPASYFEWLNSLPPMMRRQYAEGDWDLFQGQYFQEWRRELHVVKPYQIPHYWRRFVGSDWGESSPWTILWFAVSPEGKVVVYRELYARKEDGYRMDSRSIMEQFLKLSGGEEYKHKLLDPSCFDTVRGVSIADQCREAGVIWEKADRARISGWQRVREYLAWERDESEKLIRAPLLEVFETCPNLIRTLPAQVYDKTNVEDLDNDGEDHACDALRYGLMSLHGRTVVPLEEMGEEYADAARRAAHEERESRNA